MNVFRRIPTMLYVVLIACFGVGALYLRMHEDIIRKSIEASTGGREQTGTSITEEHVVALRKTLGDHAAERDRINAHFIKNKDVVSFIQRIEKFSPGGRIDLKISSLTEESPTVGEEVVHESLELLRVQFVASGSWDDLLDLLVFVETMPYVTRVDQVQLKKVGEGFTKTGRWSGFFAVTAVKEK